MENQPKQTQPVWAADTEVPAALAVRLIESQFPAFRPARLKPLGEGWDNSAYVVNGDTVFRFPRRAAFAHLITQEADWLPRLAPHLTLPVPDIRWVGSPQHGYPYAFSGHRMLPGETACRVTLDESDRAALAEPLARFLRALHGIAVDDAVGNAAPGDELDKANVARVSIELKRRLEPVRPDLLPLVERLSATPLSTTRCWVHGDLYARHLLLDGEKRLCGAIDWGDVHVGDPALDLAVAFTFLPPMARDAFRREYGGVDDATLDRAQFRALHYGVVLLEYGRAIGDDALTVAGEYALSSAGS